MCAGDNKKKDIIIASVVSVIGCLLLAGFAVWYWNRQRTGASRRLLAGNCEAPVNQGDLPWELRGKYKAVKCIGFGSFGVVLEATSNLQNNCIVAIKLNFPKEKFFTAENLVKLDREV